MSVLFRNVGNECSKLSRRKKYTVFLILEILICCTALLVQLGARMVSDGNLQLALANLPLMMLSFFIQVYIPLVIFMAACDLFSAEMQDNTIKAVLMRPLSRAKIYLSKCMAIGVFAIAYLFTLFITTGIIEVVTSGKIANFLVSFSAYVLDIVPLVTLVLMAVLINQFTRSSSLAMFLSILIYVAFNILGIFVPQTSGLLFTGYLQWHNLWLGATLPFGAILSKIGLLTGYGLVFGSLGFFLFDRRNF